MSVLAREVQGDPCGWWDGTDGSATTDAAADCDTWSRRVRSVLAAVAALCLVTAYLCCKLRCCRRRQRNPWELERRQLVSWTRTKGRKSFSEALIPELVPGTANKARNLPNRMQSWVKLLEGGPGTLG